MFGYLSPVPPDFGRELGKLVKEVCTPQVLKSIATTALRPFIVEDTPRQTDIVAEAERILWEENRYE